MKKRYFIYFSYNGTAYHGWQIQPNGISVQEVLANAIATILRYNVDVVGAGRTDTGVHAKKMVAHFDVEHELDAPLKFATKLNSILPYDIAVEKIAEVIPEAHARFDATSRKYEYHLITNKDVFRKDFAARFNENINFEIMNVAAETLKNYNDFTSFSKLHTDVKTNLCEVYRADWKLKDGVWVFTIEANRFLRNMVRAIVGTLLEVGRGKISLDEFSEIIVAKNRCKAGVSVPAKGLFLVDICYPDEIFVL